MICVVQRTDTARSRLDNHSAPWRHLCRGLLLAAAGPLSACAGWLTPQPAPALLEQVEIPFTQGDPVEPPLPDLRTEGLSSEEINTVAVYRDRSRAVVNVTSLSAYRSRLLGAIPVSGTGSGFIIDQRGTIITNHQSARLAGSPGHDQPWR